MLSLSSRKTKAAARLLWVVALVAGCGDDDVPAPGDGGGADGGGTVTAPDLPWLTVGVPPIEIAPCPDGWRAVDEGDVTSCDPYPESGALDCPAGQAHFPGEPGCAPVGSPCPAGDFSERLPADRGVVHVRPGSTGGDGSAASPYGSLSDFSIGALPTGTVIALSRGTHQGLVSVVRDLVLWGACAGETTLTTSVPSALEGVITVRGAASGELRDLSIGTSPRLGVRLRDRGTEAHLEGVLVVDVETFGVFATLGSVTARTLVVRETRGSSADGGFGRGLAMQQEAIADVSRAVFAENRDNGVYAGGEASITLVDAVVRDTRQKGLDGSRGRGLNVQTGGAADVARALFQSNLDLGISAVDPGTRLTLADVVVRDTRSEAITSTGGRGLGIEGGVIAEVRRALIEGNREVGVFVLDPESTVSLSDVVVRDTESQESDGRFGRGLGFQLGATVVVTRALVERTRNVGVFVGAGAPNLTMTDVAVRDTRGQEALGIGGRGLNVGSGGNADVTRALFERNRDMGVVALDAGTIATLTDVVVRDTHVRDCAATTCAATAGGHGAAATSEATLSMTSFVVSRAELCGVMLAGGAQVDLSMGEVRESPIGLCQQVDGYDLDRVTGDVRFTDNDTNLQATTLPVPEPTEPLEPTGG